MTLPAILAPVFARQRLPRGVAPCAAACPACVAPHVPALRRAIERREPITFVLPSFPAKSPSRTKVLGDLPDLAESLALAGLEALCEEIGRLHEPGARVVIASDGRVFADVVGVADSAVTRYRDALREMLGSHAALSLFDLDGAGLSVDELLARHAESPDAARRRAHGEDLALFNGIHRFLFEDRLGIGAAVSRNRLREICSPLAVELLRRSAAWSRLLAERFPGAIRLSIHPQPLHAAKLGIRLGGEGADPWRTPWHSVAIVDARGGWSLVPRHEAEAGGARIVLVAGRPSHFRAAEPVESAREVA